MGEKSLKRKVRPIEYEGGAGEGKLDDRIEILEIGTCRADAPGMRSIRLISSSSLSPSQTAEALKLAMPFAVRFKADLIVTPGGFGISDLQSQSPSSDECTIDEFISTILEQTINSRKTPVVLGIDSHDGSLQDAYFIPRTARERSDCVRAWKAYPRSDEASRLLTKGKACPSRCIKSGDFCVCMLVCHDIAVFSRRSEATRGPQKEIWARQLVNEVPSTPATYIVHLIHYLNKRSQGKVFTSGRQHFADTGISGCISTFRTCLRPGDPQLECIRYTTAKLAGPTLDLYLKQTS
jgi:hypothetical protein